MYWHAIHDELTAMVTSNFSQTAWLLLEELGSAAEKSGAVVKGIFDDRKIGRLEGGGGRALRRAK